MTLPHRSKNQSPTRLTKEKLPNATGHDIVDDAMDFESSIQLSLNDALEVEDDNQTPISNIDTTTKIDFYT